MSRPRVARSPVLVGRSAELAVVRGCVDAAHGGRGGVLAVIGEAGIGKSRLLAEVRERAEGLGMRVLAGRATEGGGTLRPVAAALVDALRDGRLVESDALRPYRAALARLVPALTPAADAAEPGIDPVLVLGEGVLQVLRTAGGPAGGVLLLEDLHRADAETLALVDYLAGVVHSTGVLVAFSARVEPPELEAITRLTAGESVTAVRPSRLTPEQTASLAAACLGGERPPADVLESVQRRSEGLPFLVEELLLAGTAGTAVPPTFAGLIRDRLASLGDARQVVCAAAVLGADPPWSRLGPITGLPEPVVLSALRAAAEAQLLATEDGRLRWRHALTRDAVVEQLLPPERAAIARTAAEVLLDGGAPDDLELAAELLVAAEEPGRAAELFLRLARRDLARGALRSAADLLDRAVAGGAGGALAAAVATERVRVLALRGEVAEALLVGDRALDGATGADHAELCLELARAAVGDGRWARGQEYLDRAGRADDVRSLGLAADAAAGRGEVRRAADLAAAAIRQAEAADRPAVLAETLVVAGRVLSHTAPAAALPAFRRAAQLAAELGLRPTRVQALFGLALLEADEVGLTGPLAEIRELAMDAGMLAQVAGIDVISAEVTLLVAGPEAAEPITRRGAELAGTLRLTNVQATVEVLRAACLAAAGDVAATEAQIAAAMARPHGPPDIAALADGARALPHLLAHDLPAANQHLDHGMSLLVAHASAAPVAYWGLWALLRTALDDRDGEARDTLRRNVPAMARPVNRAALGYADAVAAGREGHAERADELFTAADGMLREEQWWRRLLRLLPLERAILDRWGDPVGELRADLAVHEQLGERRLARTCRDLLRAAGAPTRRGRGAASVPPELRAKGVTSREMDVLGLVAQGLSNAAVAERLFVSPRTVETHVANLLVKTGAASRTELRTWSGTQTQ